MLKKIISSACLSLFVCQMAHAKIIELNNQNPDICRQQILQGGDYRPVVLAYMDNCSWAKKVMPFYEELSNENPNRAFFKYNFGDNKVNDYLNAKTAHDCLGLIPIKSPTFYMFNVWQGKMGMIYGLERAGLDGGATKTDIAKFIDIENNLKGHAYTSMLEKR